MKNRTPCFSPALARSHIVMRYSTQFALLVEEWSAYFPYFLREGWQTNVKNSPETRPIHWISEFLGRFFLSSFILNARPSFGRSRLLQNVSVSWNMYRFVNSFGQKINPSLAWIVRKLTSTQGVDTWNLPLSVLRFSHWFRQLRLQRNRVQYRTELQRLKTCHLR